MEEPAAKREHLGLLRLLRCALAVSVVVGAWSVYETAFGADGLPRRRLLQADLARVTADNATLTAQLAALQRQVAAEREREAVQEALVRDILGYVRPGELVFQPRPAPAERNRLEAR